jgi:DNA-binding transcriptional regulator YbjK
MAADRRPRGPTDPDRAAKIARATFDVVRDRGIAGLTHRAVAAQADVPLGSTTYHYSDRNDLIESAIADAIAQSEEEISRWSTGLDRTNLAPRLAALLAAQTKTPATRKHLLVEYELYLAAARSADLRPLSRRWDAILRTVLEERVGRGPGRVYFATYNGLILESLISENALDQVDVEGLLVAIAPE